VRSHIALPNSWRRTSSCGVSSALAGGGRRLLRLELRELAGERGYVGRGRDERLVVLGDRVQAEVATIESLERERGRPEQPGHRGVAGRALELEQPLDRGG
jgi:hypothetical protein